MGMKFRKHSGVAAPLLIDNIDTDQIIPSREMKTVSKEGLGEGLFAGWRYTKPGGRDPDMSFILNQPNMAEVSILISGKNFGCGSSREHAVWALDEFGIRAIIAKSFGEIFQANCVSNGILALSLSDEDMDTLAKIAGKSEINIDLEAQTVSADALPDWTARFEIGAYPKRMLLEGLCPIQMTLKNSDQIDAYIAKDSNNRPWLY
ncbi:3-isopropylmalate dehydratase small subunit [Hirschia litorea]|uniref:3-isopropylmalate dehydratase small subunit n=1 Tax=Hirschia litorea TaxID=1199156 RepID=A0ABW2IGY6_9PROT